MRFKYVIFIKFLLLFVSVTARSRSNDNDYEIVDLNDQCDSYCYNAIKPLLENAVKTNNKIENCDNVILSKDEQIAKLEEKLTELKVNVSIFKDLEALYIEKIKYKDDLITALEQKTSQDDNNEDQITLLKAQIDENTAAVKALKTQLSSLNDSILLQIYNAKQTNAVKIQEFPINCVPFENSTSIHEISIAGIGKFEVLCDGQTAGNGWTVVQRRFDGSENFYRNWSEYREGFGNLQGEFFMGLEKLHRMTTSRPYELYIELMDFQSEVRHARYDTFRIGSEQEKYMLKSLGAYSGTAGNALSYNLYDKFTTFDRDNDGWGTGNCAEYYASGWWYNFFGNSNLNGKYFDREVHNEQSIWWYNWKGYRALKTVKMMIRPQYSSI
ncbi:fibrinogen-like protein 1 [Drosophila innubila]|uniref:fibrinogen-like protein 1 n=1 Tax=Drosophila innubila TaxID=198719 RepID=UPI00148B47F6|nr:fibrinogen-like protein 1 [Drosophila innubila]